MDNYAAVVICHTEGCSNSGVPIEMTTSDDAVMVCGVCGTQITDITKLAQE